MYSTLRNAGDGRAWSPGAPLAAIHNSWNTPGGGIVGQEKIHQSDQRAALLEAFDSMTDEAQSTALAMLQSIARGSPRRPLVSLRLVASGDNSLNLRRTSGGV